MQRAQRMKAQYLGVGVGNHLIQGSERPLINEGPFSFAELINLEAKLLALIAHDTPYRGAFGRVAKSRTIRSSSALP